MSMSGPGSQPPAAPAPAPVPMPDAKPPPGPRKLKQVLKWGGLSLAVILGVGVPAGCWHHARENERLAAWLRELESRTSWQGTLFPVTVTFPRGPANEYNVYGPRPWRDLQSDIITCPDDSEGREYAEFYQLPEGSRFMDQPFADAAHPALRRQIESLFETSPEAVLAGAVVVKQSISGPWKIRALLIPTPHGGAVMPEGLSPETSAALAQNPAPGEPVQGKVEVDPRLGGGRTGGIRYTTYSNPRAEAEARAERDHQRATKRFEDRHHHLYVAEEVRDFGKGRILVLRRIGQVFGPGTITRALETVQTMADQVRPPALDAPPPSG